VSKQRHCVSVVADVRQRVYPVLRCSDIHRNMQPYHTYGSCLNAECNVFNIWHTHWTKWCL